MKDFLCSLKNNYAAVGFARSLKIVEFSSSAL